MTAALPFPLAWISHRHFRRWDPPAAPPEM